MRLALDDPRWLALALLAIPLAIIGLRWFATMSAARRWSAVLLRLAFLATVALLLAGLSSVRSSNRLAVIAVLDVSESVRLFGRAPDQAVPSAIDAARDYLQRATRNRGPEDLLGLVVFDGRALAVITPSAAADLSGRTLDLRGAPGTDIAAALRLAAAMVPPDAAGRLLLISDGNQTVGDAASAAKEVARRGSGRGGRLPIDVVPITIDPGREVMVESIDVPPRAAAQATVNVRVTLRATAPARGSLTLLLGGQPVDLDPQGPGVSRAVELEAGRTVLLLPVPLPPGRIHDFRAVFEPAEPAALADGSPGEPLDRRVENNTAEGFTITPGQGSVLIADPSDGGGASLTLAQTLARAGIDARVVPPSALPATPLEFQAADLLVLNNVPVEDVPESVQQAIETSVRDLGMGLLMLGGPDSFGAGGWKGSRLEPLLPVRLDLPEKLVQPDAAIVLVIDNSGSMSRGVLGSPANKQEIANQAAALAVRSLDRKDLVGVIVFNNDYNVLVPLGPNTDPERAGRRILAVSSGGGTNMGPAMREARRQLQQARASVKHLIVISDGESMAKETLAPLAGEMWTQDRIMVSSIGVGDEMDERTMADIAALGNGKFYPVSNPALLPRFLLRAVRVVRSPSIRLGEFTPRLLPTGSPLVAGLTPPPPLMGLVLTQPRPEPTITTAMIHPDGEPLLAHWVFSLGQVAAFTSDVSDWASRWIDWPGYAQLWTTAARSLARPQTSGRFDLVASTENDRLFLRLDAAGDQGQPLDQLAVPATIYPASGGGSPVELSLAQVGPGQYEATSAALPAGNYVVTITPRQGDRRLTPVVGGVTIASTAELRSLTTDTALLRQIAQVSGGRVLDMADPQAAQLFDRAELEPTLARTPLLRQLLVLAIVLMLLDIATRRIAWDRFVSSEFGFGIRERAAAATLDRSAQAQGAVSRLKRTAEAAPAAQPRPETALSDEDAQRIVEEQRQRRLRARLEAARAAAASSAPDDAPETIQTSAPAPAPPTTGPSAPSPSSHPPVQGESGLLAAKRRARERLAQDGDLSQSQAPTTPPPAPNRGGPG